MDKAKERNPWLVAAIVIFAGIVFAANMFKVPPIMGLLFASLEGMTEGGAGWLVSAMSIFGVVLALPAGGIMMKTGPKTLGLIALLCTLVGSLVGTFVGSYALLLLTRLIEGIGFGLIGVIAPAIIAACFPLEKRGLPMAIWSCWVPIGLLFMFNAATGIVNFDDPGTWRNVWWLENALLAAALVLWFFIVKVPEGPAEPHGEATGPKPSMADAFKSIPTWTLALAFMIFAIGVGCLTTFAPQYIENALGYTPAEANMYTSIPLVAGMVTGGIVMGILLNVLNKQRTMILVVGMVLTAIAFYFIFEFTSSIILAFMVVGGFIFQILPATIFTVAPEASPSPPLIGMTMGIVITGQNLGGLGPGVIGGIIANDQFANVGGYDWHMGTILLMVLAALGILISLVYWWSKNKQKKAA